MRRRILRTTLGVSLIVILLMAAAMWWAFWAGMTKSAQQHVEREADDIAIKLHAAAADGPLTHEVVAKYVPVDHAVELTFADGSPRIVAGDWSGDGPAGREAVIGVGELRVVDTSAILDRQLWLGAVVIAGVAFVMAGVATVIAVRTSKTLTEPIADLVDQAERLGAGELRASARQYGIPELDRLAVALDDATSRVAELLAEERSLTVDASHQLKTPLTALSLRLEEIADRPDEPAVRSEAQAALEQVERLSAVVDGLLRDRRSPAARRTRVSMQTLLDQQVSEWRPAFDAAGRELIATIDVDEPVDVDGGPVGQVISALVENSLLHGSGRTTVEIRAPHGATWIEVFDQGLGVADDLAPHVFDRDVSGSGGTGLGLAAAQDAAVSVGGRIALVRRRPAHFRFFLDSREHPAAVGPEAEQRAERDADDVGGDVVGQR